MAFHIPEQPNVNTPVDSFYWKGWFKDVWNWMKRVSDISITKTASFVVTDSNFYPVDTTAGAVTATLPPCLGIRGRSVVVKRTAGANNVTVAVSGSDTIEGAGSYALTVIGDAVEVVSDGTSKWYIRALGGSGGIPSGSPLTTKGDLWGYAAADARVPVGTNGKVLTADSAVANGVSWQSPTVYAIESASYLTLGLSGGLSAERVLTAGTNVTFSDTGANGTLTINSTTPAGGSDTHIQFNDGGTAFGGDADFTWNKTTNTLTLGASSTVTLGATNTVNFSGNTGRLTGVFSGATHSQRTLIQNNVANGNTNVGVIPNGTSTTCNANFYSNSDPTAAQPWCQVGQTGTVSFLNAGIVNSGTQGTLELRINAAAAASIDANKNVIVGTGAAIATNATNGFLYIPTCAGTPTGVPTAVTGGAPMVIDSTNNKLYCYIGGAWLAMN
jgi:hypothetical protein